jgi:hypothetical protein
MAVPGSAFLLGAVLSPRPFDISVPASLSLTVPYPLRRSPFVRLVRTRAQPSRAGGQWRCGEGVRGVPRGVPEQAVPGLLCALGAAAQAGRRQGMTVVEGGWLGAEAGR